MTKNQQGFACSATYVAEDELHAYADGLLPPHRKSYIESYLSAAPQEQERVQSYARLNVELHRLFDRPAFIDIPERYQFLAELLDRGIRRQRLFRRSVQYAVGTAAIVLMAGASWIGFDGGTGRDGPLVAFTKQATEAHMMLVGKGYPGSALAGTKPDAKMFGWFARQFAGMPTRAPDLAKDGFQMTGGRVLPTSNGPAMQLLYEGDASRHVTLFVGPSPSGRRTAYTLVDEGGVALVYWQMGKLAYSLVGNVDRQTLLRLAYAVADSPGLKKQEGPEGAVAEAPLPVSAQTAPADAKRPAPGRIEATGRGPVPHRLEEPAPKREPQLPLPAPPAGQHLKGVSLKPQT